jgi:putative cardiolipin synthase
VDFDYPKDASTAPTDTDDTFVGQVAADWSAGRPADQSGFFLLTDGIDALGTRLQLALKAERTIDAQYYLITNDMVGLVFVR